MGVLKAFLVFVRAWFLRRTRVAVENLALRQQLADFQRNCKRPRLVPRDRIFWNWLGNVAQTGLSEDFVANDLTVVGSLAGGGDLGNVDLIYVPEPSALVLLTLGLLGLVAYPASDKAAKFAA